jgi:hypothetical protein
LPKPNTHTGLEPLSAEHSVTVEYNLGVANVSYDLCIRGIDLPIWEVRKSGLEPQELFSQEVRAGFRPLRK